MDTALLIPNNASPATPPDFGAGGRYLASLSQTGAAGMRSALALASRLMGLADPRQVPWAWMTADKLRQVARAAADTPTERGTPRAPASVALLVNAIKGACRASWMAGHMTSETWERIRDVKPPAGSRLPAGRNVGAGEKTQLLRAAAGDDRPTGPRDVAMLAMLMGTGMRRKELAGLALADVDLASGKVIILGKGNKQREVFMAPGAMAALLDWLAVRGRAPGALFCPIHKGGKIATSEFLAPSSVSYIVDNRVGLAGIDHMTPHDLRRTLAGDMLDKGQDLSTVSAVLGHSDPKTTRRYDRRGSRAMAAAAALVDVPYRRQRGA